MYASMLTCNNVQLRNEFPLSTAGIPFWVYNYDFFEQINIKYSYTLCNANICQLFSGQSPWKWQKYLTPFTSRRCWCATYLVPLFTPGYRASKRLLVSSVHAHRTEDGLRTDGALCSPRLITVRLLKVHILLVALATWKREKDRK